MMRVLAKLLIVFALAQPACASAWGLERGHFQLFTGATVSRASHRFGSYGNIVFDKVFVQDWMEYGLNDRVTLIAAPELVFVTTGTKDEKIAHMRSTSVEGGARFLLIDREGKLAVQLSGKTAGAFDMSTSVGGQSGRQFELRALYGRGFKSFGYNAFVDLEFAHRWIRWPRPNELDIDATAGVWLSPKYMIMLQSFNTIAGGGAKAPYEYYRLHKLEFSMVRRLSKRWSLQSAAFISPGGANTVREQGAVTHLWYRW